eukprot:m51a1_g13479 hypothetical protein (69) ;mRNA; f:223-488
MRCMGLVVTPTPREPGYCDIVFVVDVSLKGWVSEEGSRMWAFPHWLPQLENLVEMLESESENAQYTHV